MPIPKNKSPYAIAKAFEYNLLVDCLIDRFRFSRNLKSAE